MPDQFTGVEDANFFIDIGHNAEILCCFRGYWSGFLRRASRYSSGSTEAEVQRYLKLCLSAHFLRSMF